MRVHVSFRTHRFKSSDPNCTSPPCFGEDLTRWLVAQLRNETGLRFDDPLEEDYGWGFWGEGDYWISAGIMDESIGVDDAEWNVSVVYDPGLNLKKRLFGKQDHALQARLIAAVHAALTTAPDITGVRWCDNGERDCGDTPA